jgi:hypothetical protein
VTGGTRVSLVVNPVVIRSTKEVKALDIKSRKCGIPTDILPEDPKFSVSFQSKCAYLPMCSLCAYFLLHVKLETIETY